MYYSCSYCLFEKGNEDQRNQIQNIIKTTLYLLMTSTINMQKLTQTEQRKIKVSLNKVRKKLIKVRILGFYQNFMHFCYNSRRGSIKRAKNHLLQHEQS